MYINERLDCSRIYFNNLPLEVQNLVTCKLSKHAQLRDCNPNIKIEIPLELWQYLTIKTDKKKKGISFFLYNLFSAYPTHVKTPPICNNGKKIYPIFFIGTNEIEPLGLLAKTLLALNTGTMILNRWYLTPDKLSKIYPSSSPDFWCCNNQTGTIIFYGAVKFTKLLEHNVLFNSSPHRLFDYPHSSNSLIRN